jgi:hypothetical protein
VSAIPDSYWRIIEPLIGAARGFLEEGQALSPFAFVGNFETGVAMPVRMEAGDEEAKDRSARAIKMVAEQQSADFIFVIMEAWSLRPDKLHMIDEVYERYGSIGASPYAIDVVTFSLETRHGVWLAQCPIKPKGYSKKKRTIGTPGFQLFTEAQGRFVDLLPFKDGTGGALH